MDRTKVLHGPQTQTYGETNYLKKNLSFGQNQGIAWSSDSNIGGNQLLKEKSKFWTELRYCMILGLRPKGKLDTPRKSKYQIRPNNTRGTSDDAFSPSEVCIGTNSNSEI